LGGRKRRIHGRRKGTKYSSFRNALRFALSCLPTSTAEPLPHWLFPHIFTPPVKPFIRTFFIITSYHRTVFNIFACAVYLETTLAPTIPHEPHLTAIFESELFPFGDVSDCKKAKPGLAIGYTFSHFAIRGTRMICPTKWHDTVRYSLACPTRKIGAFRSPSGAARDFAFYSWP
jgi:hypothetical protein